jgi:hypothetical protein
VVQGSRSPHDNGDIGWDGADVDRGDVDCRVEEEGVGGEGNRNRGRYCLSDPGQHGLMAHERALLGGRSTTHHLQELAISQGHLQVPPLGSCGTWGQGGCQARLDSRGVCMQSLHRLSLQST